MESHPRQAGTLRCVLVGTGAVANLHAKAVAAHPRAQLVAVADLSAERAAEFAAQHAVPASYDDYEGMLAAERPDVVLICTPPAPSSRAGPRGIRRRGARDRREAAGAVTG